MRSATQELPVQETAERMSSEPQKMRLSHGSTSTPEEPSRAYLTERKRSVDSLRRLDEMIAELLKSGESSSG